MYVTPFIEVTSEEVEAGQKHASEKHPLQSLSPIKLMIIANSLGRRLHAGVSFETALARALRGNLAHATRPGTTGYKAYSAAVTKIFSNRKAATKKKATQDAPTYSFPQCP
ncbi:MAG: hypothetical protein JWL88_804 [Parcubacteria group bacterium]|nr:hypothetical protein [Parcubacteria group bacterium]